MLRVNFWSWVETLIFNFTYFCISKISVLLLVLCCPKSYILQKNPNAYLYYMRFVLYTLACIRDNDIVAM